MFELTKYNCFDCSFDEIASIRKQIAAREDESKRATPNTPAWNEIQKSISRLTTTQTELYKQYFEIKKSESKGKGMCDVNIVFHYQHCVFIFIVNYDVLIIDILFTK